MSLMMFYAITICSSFFLLSSIFRAKQLQINKHKITASDKYGLICVASQIIFYSCIQCTTLLNYLLSLLKTLSQCALSILQLATFPFCLAGGKIGLNVAS